LYQKIKNEITKLTECHEICVIQAKYQADTLMALRMINFDTDIILANDSDQASILGTECICIKSFVLKEIRKKVTINNFEIFTACKVTMQTICEYINLPYPNKLINEPKYPLFDNILCPRIRCLIAVAIGCDVNLHPITTNATLLASSHEKISVIKASIQTKEENQINID
jgi:hypothetical protein